MAAPAAPMSEIAGGPSPVLRTSLPASGSSSTQEQVREYVQETRRKIEARAGISPSDNAWPSQIVTNTDHVQSRPGASHSPSTTSRLPKPVATSSQPRRSTSRSPAQSGYSSPILARFPATPGRTPTGTPPLRSGTASPVPERAEGFYHDGSQAARSPAGGVASAYSYDPSQSQSPVQSPTDLPDGSNPASPLQQRKTPTLGPPPSARRGPLHSYSQNSYVGPIPEESDAARSHPSSHSNQALPAGVEVAVPHLAHVANSRSSERLVHEDGTTTPGSVKSYQGDLVVKQIDLGRKKRPSLTTIKSGDKLTAADQAEALRMPYKPLHMSRTTSQKSLTTSISSLKSKGSEPGPAPGFFGSDSVLLEARTSSESLGSARKLSDASGRFIENPAQRPGPGRSPLIPLENLSPTSPGLQRNISMARSKSIASRYSVNPRPLGERASSFRSVATMPEPRQRSHAQFQPHEDRQSTTELPDLIKRAMRLASDLEHKKRSNRISSGYGGKEWIGDKDDTITRAIDVRSNASTTGSIGTTARTYDPGSPYSARGEQSFANWPTSVTNLSNPTYAHLRPTPSELEHRRRRCCGMPLWAFILTIIVVLILVAAAVIIPLAILVIGKHSSDNTSSSPITTCQAQLTCSNGGTNVIDSSGTCKCVCVNGFTGPTCLDTAGTGCTTTTVPSIGQVQVGSALPRLFTTVSQSFNIKLDAATIVSIFSAAALSCTTQNSLVVFDGQSGPSSKRDANSYTNSTSQDFGRVAVLYVLQDSSQLNDAASTQTSLQAFFSNPSTYTPNNITLVESYSANLVDYNIAKGDNVIAGNGA